MKKAKWKRIFAIAGMVLLVLAGILMGLIRNQSKVRAEAEKVFQSNTDYNGDTIDTRVERICKNAKLLNGIAKQCLSRTTGDVSSEDMCKLLSEEIESLEKTADPSEKYKATRDVYEKCETLYGFIEKSDADQTYKNNALQYIAIIRRSVERLEDFRADYNELAKEFNKKLNSFPYKFVAKPFIKELSLFD